jgi:hypothetical protein
MIARLYNENDIYALIKVLIVLKFSQKKFMHDNYSQVSHLVKIWKVTIFINNNNKKNLEKYVYRYNREIILNLRGQWKHMLFWNDL